MVNLLDVETDLSDLSVYEIALARNPANLSDFIIKKERGELENMENLEDIQDLSEVFKELSKEEMSTIKDAAGTIAETLDASASDVIKALDSLISEADKENVNKVLEKLFGFEKEDTNTKKAYGLSPKATQAVKSVLENLNKVRNEIPANFQWVFSSLAKLAGYPASQYGYPQAKAADLDVDDDIKKKLEEEIETLKKIDEMPDEGKQVIEALSGVVMEKDEEVDVSKEVSKELQPVVKEMQERMNKLEKENETLKDERIQEELEKEVDEYEILPLEKDELIELFKDLQKADLLDRFKKIVDTLVKESDLGKLMKEEGSTGHEEVPIEAESKLDKEVEKIIKDQDISKSRAVQKVLEKHPEWYGEIREKAIRGGE